MGTCHGRFFFAFRFEVVRLTYTTAFCLKLKLDIFLLGDIATWVDRSAAVSIYRKAVVAVVAVPARFTWWGAFAAGQTTLSTTNSVG